MTRRLLGLIADRLVPDGPVIIGVDDTIERRRGRKIKARGICRDPVRSSHGHFVKSSGLRWLSFILLTPVPWAMCVKALPLLTILTSSERADHQRGRRHKLLTQWARQGMLQLCHWLPGRSIIFIGDSSFAVHELAYAVSGRATLISRLRLDANLFAPPPHCQAHNIGRPAQKGAPLPKLKTLLTRPTTRWHRVTASSWHGRQTGKALDITSDTAPWYRRGPPPSPIRWVLVRDSDGKRAPQAFFSTDTSLKPTQIIALFVRRWHIEFTFAETRAHLVVENQRQWSYKAIARKTPALLGLYSLITLSAGNLLAQTTKPYAAAWYRKRTLTFIDAIGAVRLSLWVSDIYRTSPHEGNMLEITPEGLARMAEALCFAA